MIGITYNPSVDLFYSGFNQTAITLAELFIKLKHQICFIDIASNDKKWWDGFPIPDATFKYLHEISGLDLLIDIDCHVLPEYRTRIAHKSVVFLRNFIQFAELDKSVYPELSYTPRDYKGVLEIWCWDILNPVETLDSVQTLFHCPIKTVPFTWSSSVAEYYIQFKENSLQHSELCVHVAEKFDNTSSPILPLVAIKELGKLKFKIHMKKDMKDNKFFKENILNNLDSIPIFEEKEPYYKWGNCILFSHSRFVPIRIGLLNALWLGIPLIHNSPILKDLPTLNRFFYFGNRIHEMSAAFNAFLTDPSIFHNSINDIKQCIIHKWGIDAHLSEWSDLFATVSVPVSVPVPVSVSVPNEIIIAFSDMWPGFNYNNNFIIDSLQHINVRGVEYGTIQAHLLIFGPYSNHWKSATIPKVYFSCENWEIHVGDISLFLTPSRIEDEKHMYLPTWMTFIDWVSGSKVLKESEDNPIRIPLHFAMTTHPIPFEKREKFCGFVVSNPICSFRNETFKAVHEYKHVNSGGALYNNIGGQLALKYAGGGCGDISKYKFFEEHKFTISFENSQASGYITEKVLHSKMAGCVPIYWGDADDFVPGSIVNVSKLSDPNKIVEIIKHLEQNPQLCSKIASLPILNEEKKNKALRIISKMSNKLLELAGFKIDKIDKIFLINLDTRKDRLESLMKAEPYLEHLVTRIPAVNGKTLKMNKMIYDLFRHNRFNWKKSIIGCSLSHISVWTTIINEIGEYFLVLEDDVRFKKGWLKDLSHIPEDADILYLGGVLPPNKEVFKQCLEVNDYWSQIKPNTYFSPTPMPIFHFCMYSYIISKKGAHKILKYLHESEKKAFIEIDHLVAQIGLKTYVATELLSYCFQEKDSAYCNSSFNNVPQLFDSDIYNNTECFDSTELNSLYKSLHVRDTELYEKAWFHEIFGSIPNSWFVIQRPIDITHFQLLDSKGICFNIIHLSDEFCKDDISFYHLPTCKKVIRNYIRPDLPSHCITIPLGFHFKPTQNKSFADRELVWSFHGTDWFQRKEKLEYLSDLPHNCHLTPNWNHSTMTNEYTYLLTLENSKFCPILRGNNVETFRMYECLEAGSIPIYVRSEGDELYWEFISILELINIETWEKAKEVIQDFIANPDRAEIYKKLLSTNWLKWKSDLTRLSPFSSFF